MVSQYPLQRRPPEVALPRWDGANADDCALCNKAFRFLRQRKNCGTCSRPVCSNCLRGCCTPLPPEAAAAAEMDKWRVTCLVAPFAGEELVWMGLQSGAVGCGVYSPSRDELSQVFCRPHEAHHQRVTAVAHSPSQTGPSGAVWTASEDLFLRVWAGRPLSVPALLRAHSFRTPMQVSRRSPPSSFASRATESATWLEFDGLLLRWSASEHAEAPSGSLAFPDDVRDITISREHEICISLCQKSAPDLLLTCHRTLVAQAPSSWPACMADFYRRLRDVFLFLCSSASSALLLLGAHSAPAPTQALAVLDHATWTADTSFTLHEWALDPSPHSPGPLQAYCIQHLRTLSVDPRLGAPHSRLHVICDMVRAGRHALWVSVGHRWGVLDAATLSFDWVEPPPGLSVDKVTFVHSITIPDGLGLSSSLRREVWVCDDSGSIFVWHPRAPAADHLPVFPEFVCQVTEGLSALAGCRRFCLAQVMDTVFLGTDLGSIFALDIQHRRVLPADRHPLPPDHPLLHTRPLSGLVRIPDSDPPIIWSASQDRAFRRFAW